MLLSNTSVVIKDKFMTDSFETNMGSPQGDGISGTFFDVYLEKELRIVRTFVNIRKPEIEHDYCQQKRSSIPNELVYADDSDFATEDKNERDLIAENIAGILKKGNLLVNEEKTEHTVIKRDKDKLMERWRKVISWEAC